MTTPALSSSPNVSTFAELGVNALIVKALPVTLQQPTRVQQLAIPAVLAKRDVLALAQTGSGKTLAFGLPLLQRLLQQAFHPITQTQRGIERHSSTHQADKTQAKVRALVIVPTRELALQVTEVLQNVADALMLSSAAPITVQALCGGVALEAQVEALARQPQILVATPGRLLDLCQQGLVSLNGVGQLVLDEADRLLEMGFWPDVQKLLALMPKQKQTLLFSATLPEALDKLASKLLQNAPLRIEANVVNSVTADIEEQLYLVNKGSKAQALIALLKQYQWPQVLVFISARDDADALAKRLVKAGMKAAALHGEKDQSVRSQVLADFKANQLQVLVATDLMARGIHVDTLPVVINVDLPMSAPVYVHRIGRTARAGAKGLAISLVCHGEMLALNAIRALTARELPLGSLADFPVTDKPRDKPSDKPNESVNTGDQKTERKRPPRDKQANRRSLNKRNAKDFSGKSKT